MFSEKIRLTPACRRKTCAVESSPLNGVKLELGIILLIGLLLLLVQERITDSLRFQFLLLTAYGVAAMLWIVWRTRRVVARFKQGTQNGPQ
jgi:hypothetical protein